MHCIKEYWKCDRCEKEIANSEKELENLFDEIDKITTLDCSLRSQLEISKYDISKVFVNNLIKKVDQNLLLLCKDCVRELVSFFANRKK